MADVVEELVKSSIGRRTLLARFTAGHRAGPSRRCSLAGGRSFPYAKRNCPFRALLHLPTWSDLRLYAGSRGKRKLGSTSLSVPSFNRCAVIDELVQPSGETGGIDQMDEVAIAHPLLELDVS